MSVPKNFRANMRDTERAPGIMSYCEREAIKAKIGVSVQRVMRAVELHRPIAVYGLFSGGHDSFCGTYIASKIPIKNQIPFSAVHINTGIGVELTRQYVRDTCSRNGWPLREFRAADNLNGNGKPDPQIYEELVLKYGFPGPGHHGKMYNRLKERALRMLQRQSGANCRGKKKRRVMYISGCRSAESKRRMAHTEEVQIDGQRIWVAPLHDWTKLDTSHCLEFANQPRNIVVDLIHKSGECLCGAFVDPESNELEELSRFPQTRQAYEEIMRLISIVKPIHGWGWGEYPTKKQRACKLKSGVLCHSCH